MQPKKNTPASTFFRSLIHATDSTSTGCSAKIAAAAHAPGTDSSRRTNHRRIAAPACSTMLVMWKTVVLMSFGVEPESWYSSQ